MAKRARNRPRCPRPNPWTRGADEVPQLGGHRRDNAVENGPRWYFLTTSNATTPGRVFFNYVTPTIDTTITKLAFNTGATAQAGSTLIRFGLYSVDGSGNLTLVARTASDLTIFAAINTEYIRALDTTGGYPASYTMLYGTRYVIAVLQVGATTSPSLAGPASMVGGAGSVSPRIFGRLDSQTDLPTSVATGSVVNSNTGFYAAGII